MLTPRMRMCSAAGHLDKDPKHSANSSISDSPVFHPVYGFGGDGVAGTYSLPPNYADQVTRVPIDPRSWKGCVEDGAFNSSAFTVALGPAKLASPHCLVRGINETYRKYLTSSAIQTTLALDNFEDFRVDLEGRPMTKVPKMHDAVHAMVGGDMSNFYSSVAGQSLFHHDGAYHFAEVFDPLRCRPALLSPPRQY